MASKDVVISFRLSQEEFAPFAALLAQSSMKRSEFFRQTFLGSDKQISLKVRQHPDYTKLLFLISKTSNNLNQIAKKLNGADKAGLVDSRHYQQAMNHLISIDQALKGLLDVG